MADKPVDFNICIENVLEDEPFMLADLMSRIKDSRIGICLDTGHANAMTSAGVSIDDWVRVLSPYIRHFHLHNNDGYSDSHSSFDEGTIDMKHLLDTIEKNCRGNVICHGNFLYSYFFRFLFFKFPGIHHHINFVKLKVNCMFTSQLFTKLCGIFLITCSTISKLHCYF